MKDQSLTEEALNKRREFYKSKGWNPYLVDARHREVKLFILSHDVTEGHSVIPIELIYLKYQSTKKDPMSKKQFATYFNMFFKFRLVKGTAAYKLNPIPFGLPLEYTINKDVRYFNKKNYKSKYHGVSKSTYEWRADIITPDGEKEFLGFFRTSHQAARAWNHASKYYYGKDAIQNEVYQKQKLNDPFRKKRNKDGKKQKT